MPAAVAVLSLLGLLSFATGCTVIKVVDSAASASIGVAKGAVKTTGKVIDVAIPDGDRSEKESE